MIIAGKLGREPAAYQPHALRHSILNKAAMLLAPHSAF